jgi:hypothetical protein
MLDRLAKLREARRDRVSCLGPSIVPELLHAHSPSRRRYPTTRPYTSIRASPNSIGMSDKPKIPSWQRASAEEPAKSLPEPEQQPEAPKQPETSTSAIAEAPTPTEDDLEGSESISLLEQAKRFLDDDAIRDAPREKKVAFLESKGVSAEDIGTLLSEDINEEANAQLEVAGERAWSTVSVAYPCLVASPLHRKDGHLDTRLTDVPRRLQNQSNQHHRFHNLSHSRAKYHRSSLILNSWHRRRSHHRSSQLSAC